MDIWTRAYEQQRRGLICTVALMESEFISIFFCPKVCCFRTCGSVKGFHTERSYNNHNKTEQRVLLTNPKNTGILFRNVWRGWIQIITDIHISISHKPILKLDRSWVIKHYSNCGYAAIFIVLLLWTCGETHYNRHIFWDITLCSLMTFS